MSMLHLEIVTPQGPAYEDDIEEIIIPSTEGEMGILPNHIPLLTQIRAGELKVKKNSRWYSFATGFGFVEVTGKEVKVLTDMSFRPEEISEKEVEEAKKRAEEALKQKHLLSEEEFAVTAAALEKALAQLKVKRRHHSRQRTPETAP